MSISLISKHRRALMGVAIIWIAIRHSMFPFTIKPIAFVLDVCGYGGVDLFLFLSSFGLYYAYKKESRYWPFIKRRLSRILPYSIPIVIILFLFGKRTVSELFIDSFGLSIWLRNNWTFWYTSFLLWLYFLTPLYMKAFIKKPGLSTTLGILLVCVICYFLPYHYVYMHFRTCVFLLGFYFAYLNDHKKGDFMCWPLVIVMILGWGLLYYFFHHFGNETSHVLPFFFITPGLTLLCAWIIDKIKLLEIPLDFLGIYTYQFYLVHEDILAFMVSHYGEWYRPGIHFDFLINMGAIIVALIVAILYKKTIDYIMKKIENLKRA